MGRIVIHCPINCEDFCLQEILEKTPEPLREKYTLKIMNQGSISLEVLVQSLNELKLWTDFLSNCYTIEKLRIDIESDEISPEIQKFKVGKPDRVRFLEKFLENALTRLLEISSPSSIALIANMQHWKDISQREIQGIFKNIAKKHNPPLQFLMKGAEIELRISLTRQHLKMTMDLPVQTPFSQLKVHPTPVFPSVAFVMLKLGLQRIPQASRFVDAMCGAGNISLLIAQVLKNKKPLFIGAFDKDINWIETARENSRILQTPDIEFSVFDILRDDFESAFPYRDYDLLLSHPPYSHFVQYSNETLMQLYQNLLQVFQTHARKQACLVINTPREDILTPLITKFPFIVIQTLEIPRKATTIKLWIIVKK